MSTSTPPAFHPVAPLNPVPGPRTRTGVLPHNEVAEVLTAVRASDARPSLRLAFEFLVLTASRSGEVRGARWDEISLESAFWRVAQWQKKYTAVGLPLSSYALAILDEARERGSGDGLVFPGRSHQPLSPSSLPMLLRRLGVEATTHSFRSSFRLRDRGGRGTGTGTACGGSSGPRARSLARTRSRDQPQPLEHRHRGGAPRAEPTQPHRSERTGAPLLDLRR